MEYIAFDTETELITEKTLTPRLVCVAWFDGQKQDISRWDESREWLANTIRSCDKDRPLVGHNITYDLGVVANQFPELLPDIFALLDRDGVRDTLVREKLIRIAEGSRYLHGVSLKDLVKNYFDQELSKDEWRMDYADLREVPLNEWPQGAKAYAIKDAIVTGKVYEMQNKNRFGTEVFIDEPRQNRANFALHMCAVHGIMTDKKAVDSFKEKTVAEYNKLRQELIVPGLVDESGKRSLKRAEQLLIETVGDRGLERTPKGRVKVDKKVCANSGHPDLVKLARYRGLQTLINKDLKAVEKGCEYPIRTRFDVLLNTGRTSSSKPNLQNPPREPGIRECFVPRKGYYFASADYDSAELHTLAQVCYKLLGYSRMREKLMEGVDLHLDFAAQLLGVSYEEALENKADPRVKEARQRAKVANFGFPGGMGPKKLALYAEGYGIKMTEAEANALRQKWHENWPEMRGYFNFIKGLLGTKDVTNISHLFSNRARGGVYYTEACNSFFQGLAADGAKAALYKVVKDCYINEESPLYGSRPVLFIHDEIIIETPTDKASSAAKELSRVMVEEFNKWTPDVPIKAEACLMPHWTKNAEPCYDEDENLVLWRPDDEER